MSSRRFPTSIIVALGVVAALRIASAWSELPSVMASHFGPSGRADGFMSRVAFFVVMAGAWGLAALAPSLLARFAPPELVNVPNREYWMAPPRRAETLARIQRWLAWFGVGVSAFLLGVVELTLRANLTRSNLEVGAFLAMLGVFLLATGLFLVSLYLEFRVPTPNGSARS